jgi:PKD repeat protein
VTEGAVVTATNAVSELWVETLVTIDVAIEGLQALNDSPTVLGSSTTLMATVSAGSSISYTWAFGDGTFGSGPLVTHVYPAADEYTAVVTATNSVSWQSASTVVTIVPAEYRVYLPVVLRNY